MRSPSWWSAPRRAFRSSLYRRGATGRESADEGESYTEIVLTSLEQAQRIAALAQEKLAGDVVILDMRPVCTYTDYFVVASGKNPRQTKAIWDEVHAGLKRKGRMLPRSVDGEREGTWIIADYLDVVLHVFTPDARSFYRLEDLWGDVPSVEVAASASA